MEQTWLDEDTALKAAARKGWGFESLLLRIFGIHSRECRCCTGNIYILRFF